MEKILLHTCCAPCSASTIPALTLLTDFKIVSLWYNPNIYPRSEYISRYDSWKKYMQIQGIKTIEEETPWNDDSQYEKMWLDDAVKYEKGRCQYCYLKRLEKTAKIAQKNNIKNFSTTLLASPYQQHDVIKSIALEIASEYKLNFVYVGPRKLYYSGVNNVKHIGLYTHKYFGCKLSIR